MKLRYLFAGMLLCGATAVASAQSIGEQELAQIKGSFVKDAHTVAVQNILLGDANIKGKTKDLSKVNEVDHFFKYRVDVKGITEQRTMLDVHLYERPQAYRSEEVQCEQV